MEDIKALKEQFRTTQEHFYRLYRLALEEALKEAGLYEVDVKNKSLNLKGRLKIERSSYGFSGPFSQEIKFYPYKKNGILSAKSRGAFYCFDDEKIVSKLKESYEVAQWEPEN